jgi:hypothetical protein
MSLADLGRRAVACKHWRWMRGMLTHRGSRVFETTKDQLGAEHVFIMKRDGFSSYLFPEDRHVPDLSDPATLGCLLHLVREAWEVERAVVWWNEHDQGWVADVRPRNFVFVRDSEAHALVAALETAP